MHFTSLGTHSALLGPSTDKYIHVLCSNSEVESFPFLLHHTPGLYFLHVAVWSSSRGHAISYVLLIGHLGAHLLELVHRAFLKTAYNG